MSQNAPNVAFLGVCERAKQIRGATPYDWKHSVLGLKQVILSFVYPLSLNGFNFAIAVYDPFNFEPARIRVLDQSGEQIMHIDLEMKAGELPQRVVPKVEIGLFAQKEYAVWSFFVLPVVEISAIIRHPGLYSVTLQRGDEEYTIGALEFALLLAEPLTDDRIAAIQSNPYGSKRVRIVVHCNNCKQQLCAYAGLKRLEEKEKDGDIWYQELPDFFKCECGGAQFDLQYIRANLHGLLGQTMHSQEKEVSFSRLYEKSALEDICTQFDALLNENPQEEQVQQFIKENPVLLQQFSPERIFYKAPILTKYKTDISILNHKKELLLIELEKPGTRLMKKDGGVAAAMQRPLKQVRDWLFTFREHRLAALDCIGLKPEEVGNVKGVVIVGRDHGYDSTHLRKLKCVDFGEITFFTYDDLLRDLVTLIRTMGDI